MAAGRVGWYRRHGRARINSRQLQTKLNPEILSIRFITQAADSNVEHLAKQ
jgi:hypothetical protein